MRFSDFLKIESIWSGEFKYTIPVDKEQRLYDFYMYSLFTKSDDKDMNYVINEIGNELLLPLKEDLSSALIFSICAEIRHVFDVIDKQWKIVELAKDIEEELGGLYKKIFINYTKNTSINQHNELGNAFARNKERFNYDKKLGAGNPSYNKSYKDMMKSSNNLSDIVKLCKYLYSRETIWKTSYGGSAWAGICKGWLRLNQANDKNSLIVAIDHVYDLQHNTGTVFNKLRAYYKEGQGYGWLANALDFKRDIKNPFELYDLISPNLKAIAARFLKNKYNFTKQKFNAENPADNKNVSQQSWAAKTTADKAAKTAASDAAKFADKHSEDGPTITHVPEKGNSYNKNSYNNPMTLVGYLNNEKMNFISAIEQYSNDYKVSKTQIGKLFRTISDSIDVYVSANKSRDTSALGNLKKHKGLVKSSRSNNNLVRPRPGFSWNETGPFEKRTLIFNRTYEGWFAFNQYYISIVLEPRQLKPLFEIIKKGDGTNLTNASQIDKIIRKEMDNVIHTLTLGYAEHEDTQSFVDRFLYEYSVSKFNCKFLQIC